MAEKSNVMTDFIKPMLLHFLAPSSVEDNADAAGKLWSDYQSDLGEFGDDVLGEAVVRFRRRDGTGATLPRLGECLSMCRHITDERRRAAKSTRRRSDEEAAERAHLERLNAIHLDGDADRSARLLVILATRSHQTEAWDFSGVVMDVRRHAVERFGAPKWLLNGGKRPGKLAA